MQRALFPKDGLPRHLRAHFDDFWAAYPPRKPNPRALAEVAYARAVKEGASPFDLAHAAARFADEVRAQKIDAAFVVHAATFLRQRRYLDYLTVPAPEAAPQEINEDHFLRAPLRGRIGDTEFRRWIMPLLLGLHDPGEKAIIAAPSAFHRDWVRGQFGAEIREALRVRVLEIIIAPPVRRRHTEGAAP